ncbi:MAG: hypothetical protein KJO20_12325 [Eudoraea sp.]|nr:hypothetical protein [Eudoraea sp.]
MKNTAKRLGIWATAIGFLLLIPLIAMQFTEEVNWDITDFLIMGVVLFGIGLIYELVARRSQKTAYRVAFGVGLLGAFLLFWVNAAVGIIGSENQHANLLYGTVFASGLIGSLISRFKAGGMARTLFVLTGIQLLIPVIALIIWPPPATSWAPSVFGVFLLSSSFAVFFLISALLFRQANAR